jgi:acyl carrier protein
MTDQRDSVAAELRAFVQENFLYLLPELELADGDRLLELGIVDSLGFVELVEEVQSRYGIDVVDADITDENFGSIAGMADFVEGKRRS